MPWLLCTSHLGNTSLKEGLLRSVPSAWNSCTQAKQVKVGMAFTLVSVFPQAVPSISALMMSLRWSLYKGPCLSEMKAASQVPILQQWRHDYVKKKRKKTEKEMAMGSIQCTVMTWGNDARTHTVTFVHTVRMSLSSYFSGWVRSWTLSRGMLWVAMAVVRVKMEWWEPGVTSSLASWAAVYSHICRWSLLF